MKHATKILAAIVLLFVSSARAADPELEPATRVADAEQGPEVRRGMEMSGSPEERSRRFYQRVIAKIEPSMKGDRAKIPMYIEFFKREFVEDTRVFAFDVRFDISTGDPTLLGHVEFEEHKNALAEFFKQLGLPMIDKTELLPSQHLGEKRFGLITAPRAFVYDKPTGRLERLTECLHGDMLFILKDAGEGQLLVHAPDGYVGYIAAASVRRVDDAQLSELQAVAPEVHHDQVEQAIATAKKHLGTGYVWGGGTKEGIDCSGLVRASYMSAGVVLPRDADQQSLVGRLVGTRWHRLGLRRGDTLFFLGRRGTITHTALYLGEGKFIEATSPVVKITSFNPDDPEYSEKRVRSFCFARRVIE